MSRGRPAKPSALHILDGTEPDRDRSGEPQPETLEAVPDPPRGLGRYGAEKWRQLGPKLLAQGLLTVGDLDMLEQLCRAYQLLVMAENKLHSRGLSYNAGSKEQPQYRPRPEVAVARDAAYRYKQLLREFGQSPSSRAGLSAPPSDAPDQDPAEDFLAHGRRSST